jgi:hypothetical protein
MIEPASQRAVMCELSEDRGKRRGGVIECLDVSRVSACFALTCCFGSH